MYNVTFHNYRNNTFYKKKFRSLSDVVGYMYKLRRVENKEHCISNWDLSDKELMIYYKKWRAIIIQKEGIF